MKSEADLIPKFTPLPTVTLKQSIKMSLPRQQQQRPPSPGGSDPAPRVAGSVSFAVTPAGRLFLQLPGNEQYLHLPQLPPTPRPPCCPAGFTQPTKEQWGSAILAALRFPEGCIICIAVFT